MSGAPSIAVDSAKKSLAIYRQLKTASLCRAFAAHLEEPSVSLLTRRAFWARPAKTR